MPVWHLITNYTSLLIGLGAHNEFGKCIYKCVLDWKLSNSSGLHLGTSHPFTSKSLLSSSKGGSQPSSISTTRKATEASHPRGN